MNEDVGEGGATCVDNCSDNNNRTAGPSPEVKPSRSSPFSFIHSAAVPSTSPTVKLVPSEFAPHQLPTSSETSITTSDLGHLLSTKKRKTRRANAPGFANSATKKLDSDSVISDSPSVKPTRTTRRLSFSDADSSTMQTSNVQQLSTSSFQSESLNHDDQVHHNTTTNSMSSSSSSISLAAASSVNYSYDADSKSIPTQPYSAPPRPSAPHNLSVSSTSSPLSFGICHSQSDRKSVFQLPQSCEFSPSSSSSNIFANTPPFDQHHTKQHPHSAANRFFVNDKLPVPPPPPPPPEEKKPNIDNSSHQPCTPIVKDSQRCLTSWDITQLLIDALKTFHREINEVVAANTRLSVNSNETSYPNMIRTSTQRIEELKNLQNEKVKEENFGEAELLDEEIKKLKGEVLDKCIDDLHIAREMVLQEAKQRATFASARGSSDVERLKFESERLNLELTQIVKQFTSVDLELNQVEERIGKITSSDGEERQQAVEKKKIIGTEIERLQELLTTLFSENRQLEQKISDYDIRIAAARSKFKKQLTRLETSKESLAAAKRDVLNERRQLQQLKSSVLTERQEAGRHLDRLLSEVSSITIGIPIVKRCIRTPLLMMLRLKEELIENQNEVSLDAVAASEQLKKIFNNGDNIRTELDSINQMITSLRLEESATQQQVTALNSQKSTAIASRIFREAGRLAAEIKEHEEKEQKIDQEIARWSLSLKERSQALIEQEREEEPCRKELEKQNRLRALAMIKVVSKHQKKMEICLERLDGYCGAMEQWISKTGLEDAQKENEPDTPISWGQLTATILKRIQDYDPTNKDSQEEGQDNGCNTISEYSQEEGQDNGCNTISEYSQKAEKNQSQYHHPIVDQLKVAIAVFQETLLPLIKSEIENFARLQEEWKMDFELYKEKDGSVEVETNDDDSDEASNDASADITKMLVELLDENQNTKEFDIEGEFGECEKFLDETRGIIRNIDQSGDEENYGIFTQHEGLSLEDNSTTLQGDQSTSDNLQLQDATISNCLLEETTSEESEEIEDTKWDINSADSHRKVSRLEEQKTESVKHGDVEPCTDGKGNKDGDHTGDDEHSENEHFVASPNEDSTTVGLPQEEGRSVTSQPNPPDEWEKPQQLIDSLEKELERAVGMEDYNLAATLDEQIEELRYRCNRQ